MSTSSKISRKQSELICSCLSWPSLDKGAYVDLFYDLADVIRKGKEPDPSVGTKAKSISEDPPFQVRGVNMQVPRGSLVAIVGAVGCGKVRAA